MTALGAPQYRYVLFHFGWITITKRSLGLAVALTSLTFAALQSASLCLVTTPPEAMAAAVGRALRPLGLLGVPVRELVLTVLLALRFMAMVRGQGCWWGLGREWLSRGVYNMWLSRGLPLSAGAHLPEMRNSVPICQTGDPTLPSLHATLRPGV